MKIITIAVGAIGYFAVIAGALFVRLSAIAPIAAIAVITATIDKVNSHKRLTKQFKTEQVPPYGGA